MDTLPNALATITQTALFAGFDEAEAQTLLARLPHHTQTYAKGEALLLAGYEYDELGIVLEGAIEAVKTGPDGSQFPFSRIGAGGVFGDIMATGQAKSPVTVSAIQPTTALWLSARGLFGPQPQHTKLFSRLLANLAGFIATKYFALDRRIDYLILPSIRKRAAAYLLEAGKTTPDGEYFTIPYTKTQLAAYLGCERSALARELARMRDDGLLITSRSNFAIPSRAGLKALF